MSKYQISNNGAGKKDIWILGAVMVAVIIGLVLVLSQFG